MNLVFRIDTKGSEALSMIFLPHKIPSEGCPGEGHRALAIHDYPSNIVLFREFPPKNYSVFPCDFCLVFRVGGMLNNSTFASLHANQNAIKIKESFFPISVDYCRNKFLSLLYQFA
jgi:hypothetical protein